MRVFHGLLKAMFLKCRLLPLVALVGGVLGVSSVFSWAQTGTGLDWRTVPAEGRSLFLYGPGLATAEPSVNIKVNARSAGRSEWVCWNKMISKRANACVTRQSIGTGFQYMRVTDILPWLKRNANFNFEKTGGIEEAEAPIGEVEILRAKIQQDTSGGRCKDVSSTCSSAPIKNCFLFHQMGGGNKSFVTGVYCAAVGDSLSDELLKKIVTGVGVKGLGVASAPPTFREKSVQVALKAPANNPSEVAKLADRARFKTKSDLQICGEAVTINNRTQKATWSLVGQMNGAYKEARERPLTLERCRGLLVDAAAKKAAKVKMAKRTDRGGPAAAGSLNKEEVAKMSDTALCLRATRYLDEDNPAASNRLLEWARSHSNEPILRAAGRRGLTLENCGVLRGKHELAVAERRRVDEPTKENTSGGAEKKARSGNDVARIQNVDVIETDTPMVAAKNANVRRYPTTSAAKVGFLHRMACVIF